MSLLLSLVVMPSSLGFSAPTRNHLAGQNSVYLSRAASQPVDWYPWSAEAFEHAQKRNRPILLDVGAVSCSWCGLMDRGTYTNPETAEYINEHFVAVKVDFDASPKLVAQLQRAQAVLNLPAGLRRPTGANHSNHLAKRRRLRERAKPRLEPNPEVLERADTRGSCSITRLSNSRIDPLTVRPRRTG